MTGKPGRARRPRVIAGVDGSPHSAAALAWAAADARLRGWELVVVTACAQGARPAGPGTDPAAACEQDCDEMQARMLRGLPAGAAPPVSTRVLHGDPVAALVAAVTAADVLVVGTRGQGRVRALLLGSVAQGCAGRAPCPVVVVPSPPRDAARPAADDGPVVAGVDSSPGARAALRFAAGEAALRGAALLPVHAVYPDYTTAQDDAGRGMAGDDDLLPPLDSAWAQLDMLVRTELAGLDVTAQPVALCGDPATVLLRLTESAALVAVGARGAGRLYAALPGSVSTRLLRQGHCPVAVIPASAGYS
ncbi:MAG TPA: universal stress protein [Streptosporangiaceae bacterium]|nr:universal stress protein [Streptosporangiaceae bacterium]